MPDLNPAECFLNWHHATRRIPAPDRKPSNRSDHLDRATLGQVLDLVLIEYAARRLQ